MLAGARPRTSEFPVDYSIDLKTIPTVQPENIISGQFDPKVVAGKDVIIGAYERLGEQGADMTDDAQVVERQGYPIYVVISDATNLKVTTRGDLTLAAAIIKTRPARPVSRMGAFEEAQW